VLEATILFICMDASGHFVWLVSLSLDLSLPQIGIYGLWMFDRSAEHRASLCLAQTNYRPIWSVNLGAHLMTCHQRARHVVCHPRSLSLAPRSVAGGCMVRHMGTVFWISPRRCQGKWQVFPRRRTRAAPVVCCCRCAAILPVHAPGIRRHTACAQLANPDPLQSC
jgi:hypothetical protein